MTAWSIPGISVDVTVTVTGWAELAEALAEGSSIVQRDFIGAFAEALERYPLGAAILGERFLLQEKDDPSTRATREAVQRFCRELLEHLDEGSR